MTNLSYAQPDLGRIQESREAIRYQAIVGSANLYIKALSDELIALNAAVSDLDLTAANIFTSAITALETDDLNENLQALASLNAREPSAQVEKARQQYSQIVTQLIKLCTEQMTRLHTSLHNSAFGVQSIGISNNRFRLEELAASKINLTREYDAEQIPLAELKDDETVLNALGIPVENNINNGGFNVLESWKPVLQPYFQNNISLTTYDYQISFDYSDVW